MANEHKNKKSSKSGLITLGWILGVIILLFGSIFLLNNHKNNSIASEYGDMLNQYPDKSISDLSQGTIDSFKDKNYRLQTNPKKIDKMIKNGDDVFVYFYSPVCVHCQAYTPILMDYVNEKHLTNVYFLNVLEYPEYLQKYNIEGTPTMLHFITGDAYDNFVGELSAEETELFFKQAKDTSDKVID